MRFVANQKMANRFLRYILLMLLLFNVTDSKKTTRKEPSEIPEPAFPKHGCRIIFNEINLYSATDDQFIELGKYCLNQPSTNRAISMTNYKLVFVTHDAKLIGVCHLDGEIVHTRGRYWFYVISNNDKDRVNYNLNRCQLDFSINPLEGIQKMFPGGANHPFAIILVYNAYLPALDDIKLDAVQGQTKYAARTITSDLENKIMKYTQDMYVVATTSPYQVCEYFKTFYTGYNENSIHLLSEWQPGEYAPDHALSRCANPTLIGTTTLPFQPFLWVYSEKTLGNKNKCGLGYRFVVETTQPLRKRARPDDESQPAQFRCYSLFEDAANDINLIALPQTYQDGLQAAQDQVNLNGPNLALEVSDEFTATSYGSLEPISVSQSIQSPSNHVNNIIVYDDRNDGAALMDIDDETYAIDTEVTVSPPVANDEIEIIDGRRLPRARFQFNPMRSEEFNQELERISPHINGYCARFPNEKREEIRQLPGTPINIDDVLQPNICTWLDYISEIGKFRCKFCNYLLNQHIISDSRNSPNINYIMWKGVGYTHGSQKRTRNKQLMMSHLENPLHTVAVEYFRLRDQGLRGNDLQLAFERIGGPWREYLKATEQLLKAGFQSIKMNIAFYNFKKLTNLLNHFDVSIGHVHHGEDGVKKMIMLMSHKFHSDFVSQLLTNGKPLSLTLDLSTDINGFPIAAFMFQTSSDTGEIKVYMYRLIEAKEGETGVQIFELFKEAIKEDELELHIKEHMFGLSTDGAPNVLKVFRNQLNAYIKNEIVATHCCCHRIELVNKRVFEEYAYLRFIDETVNELFRFFNNKSAKRKRILREMYEWTKPGEPKKIKRWELKRIIKIRFINSKLRALSAIIQNWRDIGAALQDISESDSFKFEHRQLAEKIMGKLKDGTFLATLSFLIDVDKELSAVSLQLQSRGVTLIPKKMMRDTLVQRLTELKLSNRPVLSKLLRDAEFDTSDTEGFNTVTLEDFETQDIKFEGVSLEEPNAHYDAFRLFKNKNAYLESLLTQVENYFPPDVTDNLYILDPNNFPTTEEEFETYGADEIVELNEKLKWNQKWGFLNENVKSGWKKLALSLFRNPDFVNHITKKPEDFWSHFLTIETLDWTPELQKIISNVITAPCTSVEPERLFSLYSATKTKRRFSLNPTTVEAIVRIKYMGPEKIEDFDSLGMAIEFIQHYSRADDQSRRTTWVKSKATPALEVSDNSDLDSDYEDI